MKILNLSPCLSLLLLLCLQACGIALTELDLPEGRRRLVVEGGISNLAPPHLIRLSWTTSLAESQPLPEERALLILSDEQGRSDTLLHQGDGHYHSHLQGIPGRSYQLQILLDTASFTATAYMPEAPRIDSFSIQYQEESTLREEGYYLRLHQLDPQESEGYYRWLVWQNGRQQGSNPVAGYFITLSVTKDNPALQLQYPDPFQQGDSLLFQTIKMDRAVYTYYQGMLELMMNDGGLMGPLPANPPTNISGGALGVFQAGSILESSILIE